MTNVDPSDRDPLKLVAAASPDVISAVLGSSSTSFAANINCPAQHTLSS